MTIRYTKNFRKQFKKLKPAQKIRFREQIIIFQENPSDIRLNNHLLKGKYKGFHSINIGGDLRALYIEVSLNIVIYDYIGTHSQLYGK